MPIACERAGVSRVRGGVCERWHDTACCFQLTHGNLDDHLEMIKRCRLCFCCSTRGHLSKDCTKHVECSINACTHFQRKLLDKFVWTHGESRTTCDKTEVVSMTAMNHTIKVGRNVLAITLVRVFNRNTHIYVNTYCLIDNIALRMFVHGNLRQV